MARISRLSRFLIGIPAGANQLAPLSVHHVVAQVAELARPVDLGRDQVQPGVGMRLAEIDIGLLAALDQGQHVGQSAPGRRMAVVTRAEKPLRSAPG